MDLEKSCALIMAEIRRRRAGRRAPFLVAVDGRSGVGKSTLAVRLGNALSMTIVPRDDFYAAAIPDADRDARSPSDRARDAVDWRRLRKEALERTRWDVAEEHYFTAVRPPTSFDLIVAID